CYRLAWHHVSVLKEESLPAGLGPKARIGSRLVVTHIVAVTLIVSLASCFFGSGSQIEHGNVAFDISPDGEGVVFSSADGDLCLIQVKTREVRQLSKPGAKASTPAFSPDGNSIAYAADVEGHDGKSIFFCSLDGKKTQQLTDSPDACDLSPSYSPDGSHIV